MIGWYVIHSKPRKEAFVANQCRLRNIENYLPMLKIISNQHIKMTPYFPGYLFVHVDLNTVARSTFEWMPGAIGFISFGGDPTCIPNHIMEVMRRRIENNNTLVTQEHSFAHGDTVIINEGPFKNYEGIFEQHLDQHQRVRILLKFFQDRKTSVEISANQISLIQS